MLFRSLGFAILCCADLRFYGDAPSLGAGASALVDRTHYPALERDVAVEISDVCVCDPSAQRFTHPFYVGFIRLVRTRRRWRWQRAPVVCRPRPRSRGSVAALRLQLDREDGRLPPRRAGAIEKFFLHLCKYVHRDIKPGKVSRGCASQQNPTWRLRRDKGKGNEEPSTHPFPPPIDEVQEYWEPAEAVPLSRGRARGFRAAAQLTDHCSRAQTCSEQPGSAQPTHETRSQQKGAREGAAGMSSVGSATHLAGLPERP